jgi:hypothetical protein
MKDIAIFEIINKPYPFQQKCELFSLQTAHQYAQKSKHCVGHVEYCKMDAASSALSA